MGIAVSKSINLDLVGRMYPLFDHSFNTMATINKRNVFLSCHNLNLVLWTFCGTFLSLLMFHINTVSNFDQCALKCLPGVLVFGNRVAGLFQLLLRACVCVPVAVTFES